MTVNVQGDIIQPGMSGTKRGKTSSRDATPPDHRTSPQPGGNENQ